MSKTVTWQKITEVHSNPDNPRQISEEKFNQLKKSIQDFPEMLELRPLVVREGIVLGGNMRLEALSQLGFKKVPVIDASELTDEQIKEFVIKDNIPFGQWDWDVLANEWNSEELNEWGLEVWQDGEAPEYEELKDEGLEDEAEKLKEGLKKAIMIEFEPDDYEEAFELIKFFRERSGDVGAIILEHLRNEKKKL